MECANTIKLTNEHPKAILLLAITAMLWSIGGLFIKLVNANPMAIAGVRGAVASLTLLLIIRKPKFNWSLPQICAALSYAATGILFVTSNKTTTAANAILLQFTAPVYVALLGSWFLKEKTRLIDWITIFAVLGGMVLFFMDNLNMNGVLGNVLAAISGISMALFTIFMRKQKDGSPIESSLLGNILIAVVGLPFLSVSSPDPSGWIYLIILGVVQIGIPYALYAKAIKHSTALEAILIPVLEPLLNPVWVFLMLGEIPGPLSLAGGLIVLAAVTIRCVLPVVHPQKLKNAVTGKKRDVL